MKVVHNSVRKIAAIAATVIIVLSASLLMAQSDARKSFDMLKGMEGAGPGKTTRGSRLK